LKQVLTLVKAKNPADLNSTRLVQEVFDSLRLCSNGILEYREARILERIVEPSAVIMFRVPWFDDLGKIQVNRGFRIEMNSAIGPYKGGLRFPSLGNAGHPKVLAFEQVFKNSLTTLPMGGGKGGSTLIPRAKATTKSCVSAKASCPSSIATSAPTRTCPRATSAWVDAKSLPVWPVQGLANEFTGVLTGKA